MAFRRVDVRRDSQPQEIVRHLEGSRFFRGLMTAGGVVGGIPYDIVNGVALTRAGSAGIAAGPPGLGATTSSSAGDGWTANIPTKSMTSKNTLSIWLRWTRNLANGTRRRAIRLTNSVSGTVAAIEEASGNTVNNYGVTSAVSGGGFFNEDYTGTLPVAGVIDTMLYVRSGSASTIVLNGVVVAGTETGASSNNFAYDINQIIIGSNGGNLPLNGVVYEWAAWDRALEAADAIPLNYGFWGEMAEPQRIWVPFGSASAGVSGSLAVTAANDTLAGTGTTTVTGSLARTNANDTSAASGTTTVTGSLATTNADDGLAASGAVGNDVTGSVNVTEQADTLAASGTTAVVGTAAPTNQNDSLAGAGTTTVTGTLARTNADDSLAASGAAGSITGTVDVTNGNDTLSARGSIPDSQAPGGYFGPMAKTAKRVRADRIKFGVIPADVVKAAEKVAERVIEEADGSNPVQFFQEKKQRFDRLMKAELATFLEPPKWVDAYSTQIQIQIERELAQRQQDEDDLLLIL